MNVYLIGASGSGKTVIGKRIAEALGVAHIDTDAEVARSEGTTVVADIFEQMGEAYFRQKELFVLRQIAGERVGVIVSTGGGLPAIDGAMRVILESGLAIFLSARPKTLWHRLEVSGEIQTRPLLRDKGPAELRRLCRIRRPFYKKAHVIVDTEGRSLDESTTMVLDAVRNPKVVIRPAGPP